ncbi:MAG: hypothetical protein QXI22_05880 [Sulfolobales archaeon]
MMRTKLRCARCGKSAVYLARTSGEPLCLRCLEKSLVKSVRRVLGKYAKLAPGTPIIVAEPLIAKPWLCSSYKILLKAVRSHRNRIVVIGYGGECPAHDRIDRVIWLGREEILEACKHHNNQHDRATCLYRAEYLSGTMVAEKLGINTVLLMRPRDLCSLIGVVGIIAMSLSLAVESLPFRRTHTGIQVINPLYGVGSQDLIAHAFSLNLVKEDLSCNSTLDLEGLPGYTDIQSIYMHSSEMIYSSSEAIREIFDKIPGPKCPLCNTPTEGGGYCYICSSLLPLLKKLLDTTR